MKRLKRRIRRAYVTLAEMNRRVAKMLKRGKSCRTKK